MYRFTLILILTLTASPVLAQKAVITRDNFSAAYSAAQEKAREFPRIHESQELIFSDSARTSSLTWRWEYENPFRSRLFFEEKRQDKHIRFEMVNLEDKNFCRIDAGSWFETNGTCPVNAFWMGTQQTRMIQWDATSEFSVEPVEIAGQKVKRYAENAKVRLKPLPNGKEPPPNVYESVFWVDAKGRITKQEYKYTETRTSQVWATWIDTFTYLPYIKLTAPM